MDLLFPSGYSGPKCLWGSPGTDEIFPNSSTNENWGTSRLSPVFVCSSFRPQFSKGRQEGDWGGVSRGPR